MKRVDLRVTIFAALATAALLGSAVESPAATASAPSQGKAPASAPSSPPSASPAAGAGHGGTNGAVEANKEVMVPEDSAASHNAARTRMHECGHQWSTLKKSGVATGLTWKEFSQDCLARK